MKIILASKSPRRIQLLGDIGISDFEVVPSLSEEAPDPALTPEEAVCRISLSKARDVAQRCGENALVIAADTLVYVDGTPVGKPHDEAEAHRMLRRLSGREHTVVTGVALIDGDRTLCEAERSEVRFRAMTEEEISWYIATGEPMDKAGAYGAQGVGAIFVEGITGDFFNVMGLPVCRLVKMLYAMGFTMHDLGMA